MLAAEAERLGLPLPPPAAAALAAYLALLRRFNERIRLTASGEPRVLVERHVPDALVAARLVDEHVGERTGLTLVDVGAGGGLVGLPLAILLPDARVTLVEANARKCAFLRTAIFDLGLAPATTVTHGRLEQLSLPPFDVAASRATWSPAEWLRRGLALVRPGGLVALFTAQELSQPPVPGVHRRAGHRFALADGTPHAVTLYGQG